MSLKTSRLQVVKMYEKQKNTSLEAAHFGLHLSRAKALELMLTGIIRSGHVTLSRIVSCCGSSAEIKSSERRFSRFLEAIDINWECWAKQIIKNLTLCRKKRYNFIIDRTDWKIGAQAVNLLVVALQSDSWACPLCVLPIRQTQSTGNSTVEQIYKVLACAQKALGKRLVDGNLLIVAHSAQKENPLKSYRKCWKIERLFLEIKAQGFHLESS